jgi:hypothetical protein
MEHFSSKKILWEKNVKLFFPEPTSTKINISSNSDEKTNYLRQSDLMSLWKNNPKCSPTNLLSKLIRSLFIGSSQNLLGYFNNLQKTAQKSNRSIGENSPNLVTLIRGKPPSPSCYASLWKLVTCEFCNKQIGKSWFKKSNQQLDTRTELGT